MKKLKLKRLFFVPSLLACAGALAQAPALTNKIPECRTSPGKALPDKYQALAKHHKAFSWVPKVAGNARMVVGDGWARIDGSTLNNSFSFYRFDINNDGECDWYLTASAPLSTGGDSDVLNTLYLARKNGWTRIGATIPDNMPDELGAGKSTAEQGRYLFGDDAAMIHDSTSNTNYLITVFHERDVQRDGKPGYRIFAWNPGTGGLELLDKWAPNSKAAAVYAFFKAHGAYLPIPEGAPARDGIERFDPDVEAFELEQACNPDSPQRSFPENNGAVSQYLLSRCKR